jgi:CMP-N-acetylneuraminic acid synthetase
MVASSLAIVAARAGSKRLPNKNHRDFLGRPLVMWTLDFALSYRGFDHVMVSTDSLEVASLATSVGAHVPWMRPPELASDTATSVDVVMHAIDELAAEGLSFDRVALLQPTSPVRYVERWNEASDCLDNGSSAALGVRPAPCHPYWTYFLEQGNELIPCFKNGLAMRSQDLPTACIPNGSLYWCGVEVLRKYRTFTPPGTRGVLCTDSIESIDIDTPDDWAEAERLISESRK